MRVVAFLLLTLLPNTWAESELVKTLDRARSRMRCLSDAECLNEKGLIRLLGTDSDKVEVEDLTMVLAHHYLHGDTSCTVQLPSFEILEEEVMRALETDGIPGILQIFKRLSKDGFKKECITTDVILKKMPPSSSFTSMQWLRSVISIVMDYVVNGHCINDDAYSKDSLDTLFNRYGDTCSPFITAKGLEKMMTDLENSGNVHGDHHHHHSHHNHHHEGHNHDDCDHDHHDSRNYDHDHRDPRNDDHNQSTSGKYHNHDHSNHNHGIHGSSDEYNNKLSPSDHDHNDHSYPARSKQSHVDHDHNHHANFDHDHSDHNHTEHDQSNHNHTDKEHSHSPPSLSKQTHNNDHKDNYSNAYDLEVKIHPITPTNNYNGNYSDTLAPENQTIETDTRYMTAKQENKSEGIESILSSRLNDIWHPTTLSSEENSIITNVIPPLRTASSSIVTECLSAESLVSLYGLDRITISKAEFLRLCPVIVQQTVGDACDEPHISSIAPSKVEVYGYGTACVLVLCLAALSGAVLLPLMRRNARHYVIAGFQGLAFSTLASDALLHLLPECLGLHSHDHSHSHFHEEASFPEPYAQLMLGFLATTYVLFMMEAVLCALSGRTKEQGGHGHSHVHHVSEPTLISIKNKSITQLPLSGDGDQSCTSLNTEILDMDDVRKPPNLMVSQPVLCGLTSVALVVTLGDALHNFGDGLAIGAAFSANIRGGLSTAAAALCHELPHELGDFVVLLSTGLSFPKALFLNFLSGLTCFGGLYVGILVGDNEVARKWVMAVTASTFLYVALAEMVPELREHRYGSPFKMLLVKNIGIFAGVTFMCLISVYEHSML